MALVPTKSDDNDGAREQGTKEPGDPGGKVMPTGRVGGRQKRNKQFLRRRHRGKRQPAGDPGGSSRTAPQKAKTKAAKKNKGDAAEPGVGRPKAQRPPSRAAAGKLGRKGKDPRTPYKG